MSRMLTEDVTENFERMKDAFRMFDKVGIYSAKSLSVNEFSREKEIISKIVQIQNDF